MSGTAKQLDRLYTVEEEEQILRPMLRDHE
jgi:hypothetical protein